MHLAQNSCQVLAIAEEKNRQTNGYIYIQNDIQKDRQTDNRRQNAKFWGTEQIKTNYDLEKRENGEN